MNVYSQYTPAKERLSIYSKNTNVNKKVEFLQDSERSKEESVQVVGKNCLRNHLPQIVNPNNILLALVVAKKILEMYSDVESKGQSRIGMTQENIEIDNILSLESISVKINSNMGKIVTAEEYFISALDLLYCILDSHGI